MGFGLRPRLNVRMKRLAQFVAIIAVALLAVQPAAEALTCATVKHCAMGMSVGMGPTCSMARVQVLGDCLPGCCAHSRPAASTAWAAPAKPKVPAIAFVFIAVNEGKAHRWDIAGSPKNLMAPSSPPLFVLHRVFRI